MLEQLITKLISSLTEPSQLILLLWIVYLIRDKIGMQNINTKLLEAQQDRGVTLTKIIVMIESLLRSKEGGVK
jgi:hypothetical protein